MLVYYDETGTVLYTLNHQESMTPPDGQYLDVPDQDIRPDQWKVINGVLTPLTDRMMRVARKEAVAQINEAYGRFRSVYISVIPWQETIYTDKRDEAVRYLELVKQGAEPTSLEDFPFIEGEVGITANTAYEVAQIFSNMSNLIKQINIEMESDRQAGIKLLDDNATTPEEYKALADWIVSGIEIIINDFENGGDGEDE